MLPYGDDMPKPRSQLISLQDTPWIHCVSRCVRRSYLTGFDRETGIDYSHRRGWIVSRLELLADAFSIDIAAYAIMSNHHHVVVRVDQDKAKNWTWQQVIKQWHKVYTGSFLSQRFERDGTLPAAELSLLKAQADTWRERLISVSWFMRALNEPIARWANAEDNITGHFYEGRFKSQALLDERALLTCMAYV
ncbi:MAG: transposase, partial [Granulosicoccaceae bacterium]